MSQYTVMYGHKVECHSVRVKISSMLKEEFVSFS
jgi:hypothetical protein